MSSVTQPSQLLSSVLQPLDPEERVTILDLGAALPETLAFYSEFRVKLYFADLFVDLPLTVAEEGPGYREQFAALLQLPADVRFDVCLFWDLFNFLDDAAIRALLAVLRPHLHPGTRVHAFGARNRKVRAGGERYGICARDSLSVRYRTRALSGYRPLPQSTLQDLMADFQFERSVLLADGRLELLMRFRE